MTDEENARKTLQDFEQLVLAARRQKYSLYPTEMEDLFFKSHPLTSWDLLAFFDSYLDAGVYPPDRLARLVYYLMDVKLQLYYLMEVDLGLHNLLVYDRGYVNTDPRALPHLLLTRLSLDQSLILKSRVLWERLMNLLYYLETGEELENKVTRRRSKRTVFFERMLVEDRWRFLEPYGPMLERYESAYRSPESHKSSVLRAELMGRADVDPQDLLRLMNSAINALWENMLSIISGGRPTHFTEMHMNDERELDPKYWGT